jgi:hypothetical protein
MGSVSKLFSLLFDHGGDIARGSSFLLLSYERPPATIVLAMSGQSFEQVVLSSRWWL